jgi:hypothetical protein
MVIVTVVISPTLMWPEIVMLLMAVKTERSHQTNRDDVSDEFDISLNLADVNLNGDGTELRKVQRLGGSTSSLGSNIPEPFRNDLGICQGDQVVVINQGCAFVVIPLTELVVSDGGDNVDD